MQWCRYGAEMRWMQRLGHLVEETVSVRVVVLEHALRLAAKGLVVEGAGGQPHDARDSEQVEPDHRHPDLLLLPVTRLARLRGDLADGQGGGEGVEGQLACKQKEAGSGDILGVVEMRETGTVRLEEELGVRPELAHHLQLAELRLGLHDSDQQPEQDEV